MKHSQETFTGLVEDAYKGALQLPAFQRDWKWERGKVISLYDSLRKQFPIGNFLFLKTTFQINLSPKLFEGSENPSEHEIPERLALDGQQRITAGIALLYGIEGNKLRYFINIQALVNLAEDFKLDIKDDDKVNSFIQEIDDGDNYLLGTTKQTEENELLLKNHLLSTRYLRKQIETQKALTKYEKQYPNHVDFIKFVLIPHFTLDNNFLCPVITLTETESLTAVTRIFSTINTTGKRLTPIEIVNAILFANDINLKEQVKEFHEASEFLENMDKNGETLLQTIALLANKTPKKSLLPKTITHETFKAYYKDALDLLDHVGKFLSENLGVGISETSKLIPYDSILPPMATVFKKIKNFKGPKKVEAEEKIEKWFVGSALAQRYQEGVHNKQENDAREIIEWIEGNDSLCPQWLNNVYITPAMKTASPDGAIGKLLRVLINNETPKDPLTKVKIGYYEGADEQPQDHHIWPRKFCTDHLPDWDENVSTEWVLNLIPISAKTNKTWDKMDPNNQINHIDSAIKNKKKKEEILKNLFLSEKCVEIMKRKKRLRKITKSLLMSDSKYLLTT